MGLLDCRILLHKYSKDWLSRNFGLFLLHCGSAVQQVHNDDSVFNQCIASVAEPFWTTKTRYF